MKYLPLALLLLASCAGGVKVNPKLGVGWEQKSPAGDVSGEAFLKAQIIEIEGRADNPLPRPPPDLPPVSIEVKAPAETSGILWAVLCLAAAGVAILFLK